MGGLGTAFGEAPDAEADGFLSGFMNQFGDNNNFSHNTERTRSIISENSSPPSTDSHITEALRRARINSTASPSNKFPSINSRGSSGNSTSGKAGPTMFNRNNTSQQNLDSYISRNRNQVKISSYFQRSGKSNSTPVGEGNCYCRCFVFNLLIYFSFGK